MMARPPGSGNACGPGLPVDARPSASVLRALPAGMSSRIPAFVNPSAGSAPDVLKLLRADPRFDVHEVEAGELQPAVRAAVAAGARRVLVSGGDGTIASAADTLRGADCELAVLPGGTLNHFARDLGLPRDALAACVEIAATGEARPVDVGTINGRVFLNTGSIGVYVAFVRVRERLEPFMGYHLASLFAAVRCWASLHGFDVAVTDEDGTRSYHTPLLYVGVGERELDRRELGARVPNGPRALHAFVLRETARARLLGRAIAVLANGTRSLMRWGSVEAHMVQGFVVHLDRPAATVALDGELVRLEAPFEFRFVSDALRVVAPAEQRNGEKPR